jgi:hypothetical protein
MNFEIDHIRIFIEVAGTKKAARAGIQGNPISIALSACQSGALKMKSASHYLKDSGKEEKLSKWIYFE